MYELIPGYYFHGQKSKNMIVTLKIKYTEEIRNSIEWMKDKCQENPTENRININKKRTVLLKKENKEKI